MQQGHGGVLEMVATQNLLELLQPETAHLMGVLCLRVQHGHGEFLKMVATQNLPEPLQKVKGALDSAVGAVAGMLPGGGGAEGNASEGSVADEVRCACPVMCPVTCLL